ncbi:LuxR family transcriptional regulator [Kitasatospora sp. NBC_01287]|uniref:LuxR family transcriptional regulator n=1 Tax=Kitasatospora sp. NBC_01287 TaxID=2903573 RepID=UPI00224F876F|nr:LuxR family transcriptional regulator [Kitasatospora sp. NBC_01287]MCX4747557.1 LuxR family transcriptional regulator [Kitasatospora sp. NBC_01287]
MTEDLAHPRPAGGALDPAARALYLELSARGGQFSLAAVAEADTPALARLQALGLVLKQQDGLFWTVVNPRTVASRISAELRSSGAALLDRADQLDPIMLELASVFDRALARPRTGRAIQEMDQKEHIQQRLEQLGLECRQEVLAAQPGGARPAGHLPQARTAARDWRRRGVLLRTIYQPGARTDPGTARYAAYATGLGARIRILDEEFLRVLVFDRRVAVVASYEDGLTASFTEDPVLVELVVNSFERDWERAERVRWEGLGEPGEPVEAGDGPLVGLLARGLTQRVIATRLGLSERTVAGQIARLRDRYEARTLFELGWQMRGGADG